MTRIEICRGETTGRVDPAVFGHFIEHMGRCVYGGIVDSSGRLVENVVQLIRELEPPVIRYPGGCFAAEYHWWEGVGDRRPGGIDTFWSRVGLAPAESNLFGTDEFLDLCAEVGAEAYLTVNMGTGTPTEAAEWVRYTAGRVRLWSLGNEVFGPWETGHQGPREYARHAQAFADAMLGRDPELDLVGVGADSRNYLGWNDAVLDRIGRRLKWLSLHFYAPGPEAGCLEDTRDGYLTVTAASYTLAEILDRMISMIAERGLQAKVALDEWAVWSCDDDLRGATESGESASIRDALFAASVFHRMIERASDVTLACYAQLVNVLGLIQTEENGAFATPVFHVFRMYRAAAGCKAIPAAVVESPVFESPELGRMPRAFEVPFVDAAAVEAENGDISLFVINRHPSSGMEVEILDEAGGVETLSLVGDGPFARNSFSEPDLVSPVAGRATLPTLSLPPHSVTRVSISSRARA